MSETLFKWRCDIILDNIYFFRTNICFTKIQNVKNLNTALTILTSVRYNFFREFWWISFDIPTLTNLEYLDFFQLRWDSQKYFNSKPMDMYLSYFTNSIYRSLTGKQIYTWSQHVFQNLWCWWLLFVSVFLLVVVFIFQRPFLPIFCNLLPYKKNSS